MLGLLYILVLQCVRSIMLNLAQLAACAAEQAQSGSTGALSLAKKGERMEIRRAAERDIADINELLNQVNLVHHQGRPDVFKLARKYNDDQLKNIIKDDAKPIFVAVNEANDVVDYAFCMHQQHISDNILTDIKIICR